jgi:large subunit ribosomal protein L21e
MQFISICIFNAVLVGDTSGIGVFMTRKSKGTFTRRTRNIVRHHKLSVLNVSSQIKRFGVGERVAIIPKSNYRDAPHPRYKGKIGTIVGERGSAYIVEISVMGTRRKLIVLPLHLEKRQ